MIHTIDSNLQWVDNLRNVIMDGQQVATGAYVDANLAVIDSRVSGINASLNNDSVKESYEDLKTRIEYLEDQLEKVLFLLESDTEAVS